jgi:hypothetical protein
VRGTGGRPRFAIDQAYLAEDVAGEQPGNHRLLSANLNAYSHSAAHDNKGASSRTAFGAD